MIRKLTSNGAGYLQVRFREGVNPAVHRLVAAAFLGPRPNGMQICHGDGNRQNNRVDNLRYDTPSANRLDAVRHGTHPEARKTHCPRNHPYNEANTYYSPRGDRQCRECKNAYERSRRAKKRAARAA